VARVLVLLLWVAGAALTWWTAPREVSYDRALAAVSGGEVRAYQWGNNWEDGGSRWFEAPWMRSVGQSGPWFAWRDGDHRVYWTDTALAPVDQTFVDVNGVPHGGGAAPIARQLDPAGAGELIPWRGWVQGVSVFLALTFLIVVLVGPAPVLGTRWYWFWMVALIPHALGLVFWALRDRPWTPAENAGDRDRGWFGAITAIVANFVIAIVLLGLSWALGDRWIPQ
jgi:hypothetical protein